MVGVVFNLAVWFTIYTLFETVTVHRGYGAVFHQPSLATLDIAALAITVAALVAVFVYKVPTLRLVLTAALVGIAHQLITN